MTLYAGVGICDITPPVGSLMAAFPRGREKIPRKTQAVRDPLTARALVLKKDETMIALCSLDLCAFRTIKDRTRDAIHAAVPALPQENIMIAVTHTHAGPETSFLFGGHPESEDVTRVIEGLTRAVHDASSNLFAARLSWGKTTLPQNHNRRGTEDGKSIMLLEYTPGRTTGPTDPDLHVMRLDAAESGVPKAIFFHYTAHALTLGPQNDDYSADYPGEARRLLEEAMPGCTTLFFNGAAGNIHPRQCMRKDDTALRSFGKALADATLIVAKNTEPIDTPTVRLTGTCLGFTSRADAGLTVPLEIAVLRIGPLCFGFVPGEFFVEHQLRFKDAIAPAPGTLIGYANGWPGYAPTIEAYGEGGYGVDFADADPPEYCRTALPKGAAEEAIDNLLCLCKKQAQGAAPD